MPPPLNLRNVTGKRMVSLSDPSVSFAALSLAFPKGEAKCFYKNKDPPHERSRGGFAVLVAVGALQRLFSAGGTSRPIAKSAAGRKISRRSPLPRRRIQ
jgi:hypothetical protein